MKGKTINEIQVGDAAEFSKTVSETDIYLFAGITGDLNPAHINEEAAAQSRFGGRIAHGMLVSGFISTVLGMYLPGPGTIYLSQELKFTAPVRIGETVTARAEVIELDSRKGKVTLKTIVTKQDGVVAVEGQAVVLAPK